MKNALTFTLIFLSALGLSAQEWKKQAKKADRLAKEGQYEKAAQLYESAWEKKSSKTELMYKAGECYYELKDYRRASEAFQKVKNATGEAGLAGLKYARSLKQTSQYQLANEELVYYIKRYKGDDKKVVAKIVKNEIQGCELALQLAQERPAPILVEHLNENVNTLEDEFAPLLFSDDILYFSSTSGNQVKMYRSQRQSGSWTQAVIPDLPDISNGTICNGSFSPNGKRFYFTVCQSDKKKRVYNMPCQIYMTKNQNGTWSEPQPLHDYIRGKGTTATHPHVIYQGNEEVLFFASDREGGFGGLDIWITKRQLKADDIDFTLPQNVGPAVNTLGDEISPYYNSLKEQLYFSSNGLPTIGGFDIFSAQDIDGRFNNVQNLGLPLNSPNDDYYFIEETQSNGGFLVSNRLFGLEKITSHHDDIFFFTSPREEIVITGTVTDKASQRPMEVVVASLFEIKSNDRQRLLQAKTFPKGKYEFVLLPNKEYSIVVEQPGFGASKYDFSTFHHEKNTRYTRDFALAPGQAPVETATASTSSKHIRPKKRTTSSPQKNSSAASPPRGRTNANSKTLASAGKPKKTNPSAGQAGRTSSKPVKRRKATSDAPTHSGVYYKVQLTVVIHYNPNQSQFREVKKMGRLDTEFLPAKNWNRVLLADFFNVKEAHAAMIKAQKLGFFDAFLVKYRDGKRITP